MTYPYTQALKSYIFRSAKIFPIILSIHLFTFLDKTCCKSDEKGVLEDRAQSSEYIYLIFLGKSGQIEFAWELNCRWLFSGLYYHAKVARNM